MSYLRSLDEDGLALSKKFENELGQHYDMSRVFATVVIGHSDRHRSLRSSPSGSGCPRRRCTHPAPVQRRAQPGRSHHLRPACRERRACPGLRDWLKELSGAAVSSRSVELLRRGPLGLVAAGAVELGRRATLLASAAARPPPTPIESPPTTRRAAGADGTDRDLRSFDQHNVVRMLER